MQRVVLLDDLGEHDGGEATALALELGQVVRAAGRQDRRDSCGGEIQTLWDMKLVCLLSCEELSSKNSLFELMRGYPQIAN